MILTRSLALTFLLTLTSAAFAKSFKNSFIKFELPHQWECEVKGSAWNCSNKLEKKVKSAVIVFAAKKAGDHDTLDNYKTQISNKPGVTVNGQQHFQSKKIKLQETKINGQTWVDGLSYNSEAPEYYTRYLATVKNKTAVIITFTSHKNYYTTIVGDFINAVNSIEILNPEDSKITAPKAGSYKKTDDGNDLEPIELDDDNEFVDLDEGQQLFTFTHITIALMALVILIVLLRKK